jgi:hypothetical protein
VSIDESDVILSLPFCPVAFRKSEVLVGLVLEIEAASILFSLPSINDVAPIQAFLTCHDKTFSTCQTQKEWNNSKRAS